MAVFLFAEKREFMKISRYIHCPKCGTVVGKYDGRSTIDKVCKCRKCNKQVIYRVNTGETEIKNIPPRRTSSGMTF